MEIAEYNAGIAAATELLRGGADLEAAILKMKRVGFSPIECIKGVMEITGSALADATRAVHFSAAWSELRE